ncbi:hypothetical protein PG630_01145 [Riemerella anatipestifer]|nr:hypothetical protein [Riemerella anatipestifer]
MYCQTVIKRRNAFRGCIGVLSKRSRTYPEAISSKKRLPKWQKGKFTKHYFEGTSRIVSKLGEGTFHQPSGLMAGGIDYIKQSAKIQEAIDQYIKGLNIPPGPPTQHGIYGTPDFTGVEYPSIDWSDISQDQEPPEGWPRPPKFNEPGDVPGPPVQYGDSVKPDNVKGGFGYVDNGIEEKNLYFYHPDHLGSSSYITDANGDVNQHTEYMAFGEVLFDEHKVSRRMPYLFNGKELDSETGLYYYGARYYDPRVSIFLNVDPLVEKTMQPYAYTNNNPIMLIDPTGMEAEDPPTKSQYIGQIYKDDTGIFIGGKDGSWNATRNDGSKETIIPEVIITKSNSDDFVKNTLDKVGNVNDVIDNTGSSLQTNAGLTRLGSNRKLYFETLNGGVFKGNQYVSTISVAKYGSKITRVTGPIGRTISVGQIGYGVYKDGGTFGNNAKIASGGVAGGTIGGIGGAWGGAKFFGAIGLFIGGPPGGAIGGVLGGIVGGVAGGYYGGEYGEQLTKEYIKK